MGHHAFQGTGWPLTVSRPSLNQPRRSDALGLSPHFYRTVPQSVVRGSLGTVWFSVFSFKKLLPSIYSTVTSRVTSRVSAVGRHPLQPRRGTWFHPPRGGGQALYSTVGKTGRSRENREHRWAQEMTPLLGFHGHKAGPTAVSQLGTNENKCHCLPASALKARRAAEEPLNKIL